jgi:hypothetical protein
VYKNFWDETYFLKTALIEHRLRIYATEFQKKCRRIIFPGNSINVLSGEKIGF